MKAHLNLKKCKNFSGGCSVNKFGLAFRRAVLPAFRLSPQLSKHSLPLHLVGHGHQRHSDPRNENPSENPAHNDGSQVNLESCQ